jgi:hypothetical protein
MKNQKCECLPNRSALRAGEHNPKSTRNSKSENLRPCERTGNLRFTALPLLLVAAFLLASIPRVSAQTYSIDWFTVGGGGGVSTGGVYSVTGTMGQSDAGAMGGGTYSLTGGFWALYAVQTPGAPTLRIFLTATNTAVIAWPTPSAGYTLQSNTNLATTNWPSVLNAVNVVGSENQVIISPPAGNRFFRLSHP